MFTIYDPNGMQTPYVPGAIRNRRVEPTARVQALRSRKDKESDSHEDQGSPASPRGFHRSPGVDLNSPPRQRERATRASMIMTAPVFSLTADTPISLAARSMEEHRIHHVPVLSASAEVGGKLVGIVSDRDLLRSTGLFPLTAPVARVMTREVLTAAPETSIRDVARVLFEEGISAMPIVETGGELVGILTRSDILRAVIAQAPLHLWI